MTSNYFKFMLIRIGILGYMISILFNGYLMHLGLTNSLLATIRPYLPEFFVVFIIVGWLASNPKIERKDVFLLTYLIGIVGLFSIFTIPNSNSVLVTVRDLYEPFILLAIFSGLNLCSVYTEKILTMIKWILAIFTVISLFFAVTQYVNGSAWTAEYFVGYVFYGVNNAESLRLSHGWLGFKVLGTIGSAETFGSYSTLGILFFLCFKFKYKITNLLLITISLINILLSGMKTSLLVSIVLIIAIKFLPKKKSWSLFNKFVIIISVIAVATYMVLQSESIVDSSLYIRFILWRDLLSFERVINIIIPYNLFYYSDGAGNTGIISFWDNSYLYLIYSVGIVGLLMILDNYKYKYDAIKKTKYNLFVLYLLCYIAISSLTTCIFFGRNFIGIAMILLGIIYSNQKDMGTSYEKSRVN